MLGLAAQTIAGFTAFTLCLTLQSSPPSQPSGPPPAPKPVTPAPPKPPGNPRERLTPPEEIYKPSSQTARQEGFEDPKIEGPAKPEEPVPEAAADQAAAAPAAPPAATAPPPTPPPAAVAAPAAPAPARGITNADVIVLGVLALVVLLPLAIGVWWILANRSQERAEPMR
jgi:hypothetical protein